MPRSRPPLYSGAMVSVTGTISAIALELRSPPLWLPPNAITPQKVIHPHHQPIGGMEGRARFPAFMVPFLMVHVIAQGIRQIQKKLYQKRFGSVSTSIITGRLCDMAVKSAFLSSSGRLTRIPIPPHTSANWAKSGFRRSVA